MGERGEEGKEGWGRGNEVRWMEKNKEGEWMEERETKGNRVETGERLGKQKENKDNRSVRDLCKVLTPSSRLSMEH